MPDPSPARPDLVRLGEDGIDDDLQLFLVVLGAQN
jgi:hypothetical protein